MRTALLCIALVLGWVLPASSETPEMLTIEERDRLVSQMSLEISYLLEQKKVPTSDGRQAASRALQSLEVDPPFKTKEEIDEWSQRTRDFGGLDPKELRRSVAEGLHNQDANHRSPPPITLELAYDLMRLTILGGILEEAHQKSEALDALTKRAFAIAWSLKEL